MDYRNERDALRGRVERQELELAEARRELQGRRAPVQRLVLAVIVVSAAVVQGPREVAPERDGRFWVADDAPGRIQRFHRGGKYLSTMRVESARTRPKILDMAAGDGHLFAVNAGELLRFTSGHSAWARTGASTARRTRTRRSCAGSTRRRSMRWVDD